MKMKKLALMLAIVFACGVTFAAPVATQDEKPKTEQKEKKDGCCAEKKECTDKDKKACDKAEKKACCEKKTEKKDKE